MLVFTNHALYSCTDKSTWCCTSTMQVALQVCAYLGDDIQVFPSKYQCAYLGDDICSMWLFACAARSTLKLAAVPVLHVGFTRDYSFYVWILYYTVVFPTLYSCTDKSMVLYLDNASSAACGVCIFVWVMISGWLTWHKMIRSWMEWIMLGLTDEWLVSILSVQQCALCIVACMAFSRTCQ